MGGDIVENKLIGARLFGHQTEAVNGRLARFVNPRRARRFNVGIPFGVAFRRVHGEIANHQPRKLVRMTRRCQQRNKPAKTMRDKPRRARETGRADHRHHRVSHDVARICIQPAAIAHARQIERNDVVAIGDEGGDKIEPARMGTVTMHKNNRRCSGVGAAPIQKMQLGIAERHAPRNRLFCQRVFEPLRLKIDNFFMCQHFLLTAIMCFHGRTPDLA